MYIMQEEEPEDIIDGIIIQEGLHTTMSDTKNQIQPTALLMTLRLVPTLQLTATKAIQTASVSRR